MAKTTAKLTDLLDAKFMARLDGLDLLSRKILQGKLQGERRARRRGQSAEFADHRPYVVGDDLRFIDWNIYGRLDQLFLKLFLEEQDLSLYVLADMSGSVAAGEPAKALAIKKLAAALSYIGLVNNCRVTVSRFAEGITGQVGNMRGRVYAHRLADFLLDAEPDGVSHFERACRELAAGRTGSGVVVILSDFLFKEGFDMGLRRLVSDRYEIYALHVLSPQELGPELSGDLRLVDMEDGDQAEVTVNPALLDYYKRALSAYCNELKSFCTARGASYVLMNSADSIEQMVLTYLRRKGMLR